MEKLVDVLQIKILGNTLERYLISLAIFVGSIIVLKIIERFVVRRLKSFAEKFPSRIPLPMAGALEKSVLPLSYFIAFYFAVMQLALDPILEKWVRGATLVVLTIQLTRAILMILVYLIEEIWLKKHVRQQENVL